MARIFRGHFRWVIAGLLFLMATIAFLDKQTLSVLEKTLEDKLGFSPGQYSYIIVGLLVATAVGYIFAGGIIDRYGARRTFVVALLVWSIATILHSMATGWISLLVLRVFLGLGESFYTPVAARVMKDWIPRQERGICWAMFSTGNYFGAILAAPLIANLALGISWQFSFIATGALGAVLLVAWLWLYDSPERHPSVGNDELNVILNDRTPTAAVTGGVSVFRLLRQPWVLGFFFTRFLTDSITFFFLYSMPRYFQVSRHFSLQSLGYMAWIPYVGAAIGSLSSGTVSDWLVRGGMHARTARKRMLLVSACLMPLTLVAVRVESVPLALGLITVVMLLQGAWTTTLTTLIIDASPPATVGSVTAVALMGGAIGGSIIQPLAGRMIQTVGYVPIFTALGFLQLAAFAILSIGIWTDDRQKRRAFEVGIVGADA